jgi:hypothetical protein
MQQNILQEKKNQLTMSCYKKEALPLEDHIFIYSFIYGLFNDISS